MPVVIVECRSVLRINGALLHERNYFSEHVLAISHTWKEGNFRSCFIRVSCMISSLYVCVLVRR